MEFHGLHRKTLQSLCKKNNIPANRTNAAMAEALSSLPTVIGVDEAQEEALRTPTSKPVSLRPPNPPRSCRRSSVLPLLQEESFPEENKDFPTSLASAGTKRRRTSVAVLFPCSEQHVTDEMPERKENSQGTERVAFVLEKMCEKNGNAHMKINVKEEVASSPTRATGGCLDAEGAVMPTPAGSRHVEDFYVRGQESEDMAAEMTRGKKEAEENECEQHGDLTRAIKKPSSLQLVESLKNVELVSDYRDADMMKDKKGGNCLDEAAAILEDDLTRESGDCRYETVTTPISLQLVAEQGSKNVEYVSECEDAEMMKDKKGGDCLGEAVAILEGHMIRASRDCRYEAITTPNSTQLLADQGLKNVELVSEDADAGRIKDKKGGDCLAEATAMVEDQSLIAYEEMVVRGEWREDEKGGEEANVESFYRKSELTCLDEAVCVPCSQESTSMLKDQEEFLQGANLSEMQSDEQEQGLKDDVMRHAVREVEGRGLKLADISSEEPCESEARSEDKDAAMVKYTKLGEVNLVSFSGKSDLISASGGCLDEAVRLLCSQESVNTVSGPESTLMQSPPLGGLGPVEQDQGLKDDRARQVLRGEIEEQSLKSAESESEEILVSKDQGEDMNSEMMNDLGSVEQGQGLNSDGGHQVLRGEVEHQSLNNVDFESEEMLANRERSECMDPETMNGVKTGERDQGLKDGGVQQLLEDKTEKQSLYNTDFESGEISEDMDAETLSENKGEERIQVGESDFGNHIGEVRLPASGDQISPFNSEAKNPTLANIVCGSKEIQMVEDQECESPQEVLEGNMLAETLEMPVIGGINEEKEAENRISVEIQVELGNEIGIQRILPEIGETVKSPTVESNSGTKSPVLEEGEAEKREFVEGTDSGKGDSEVVEAEMATKKRSAKKADLRSLSLRKLKVLYGEKKQVGKLEMENKAESKTENGGTKTKDELEERSAEKARLNGLSLRQLKQMYKHRVAKNNVAEARRVLV